MSEPLGLEQPFISHLIELRDRILRTLVVVLVVFLGLFPFANDIYLYVAAPLMAHLPAGTSMIATEVASPFLTPFKLSLVAAVFFAVPYILYQLWSFVAPGLYQHEKRLVWPLLISSILLFYLGVLFAYYVVFPLIFGFLTGVAPEGVAVMTDISRYLDFVLTLFFAFGIAFEVPIATILMVWMGVTSPQSLAEKRPYIIVGAFVIGMLLTPPDVISQTLLALPMWVLFEVGVIFSRPFYERRQRPDEGVVEADIERGQAEEDDQSEQAGYTEKMGEDLVAEPPRPTGADISADDPQDPERFVPMTEEEMEAELDAIEAIEEAAQESDDAVAKAAPDPVSVKLERVNALRSRGESAQVRTLLYEVLEEGDADQRMVARNILAQLDD